MWKWWSFAPDDSNCDVIVHGNREYGDDDDDDDGDGNGDDVDHALCLLILKPKSPVRTASRDGGAVCSLV